MNAIASALRGIEVPVLPIKRGVLSGLSTRHVVLALLFTVGYQVLGNLGLIDFSQLADVSRWKGLARAPIHLTIALAAVIAAVAAENTFKEKPARFLRYPSAVLIAAVFGTWLIQATSPFAGGRSAKFMAAMGHVENAHLMVLGGQFVTALYVCTLVVTLHAVFEASHRAGAALHQARLDALDEERAVCATELRAMEARVDPELLFDSLRSVDVAYASDPALGQAKLDALIGFLRTALPGRTAARATVAHEKELVEAYAALVAPGTGTEHRLEFNVDAATLRDAMPPMIVLPLVRWAWPDEPANGLVVSVARGDSPNGTILKLTVEGGGPACRESAAGEIAVVRERLESLYANEARFSVSTEDNRRRAVVEFPASRGATDGSRLSDM